MLQKRVKNLERTNVELRMALERSTDKLKTLGRVAKSNRSNRREISKLLE